MLVTKVYDLNTSTGAYIEDLLDLGVFLARRSKTELAAESEKAEVMLQVCEVSMVLDAIGNINLPSRSFSTSSLGRLYSIWMVTAKKRLMQSDGLLTPILITVIGPAILATVVYDGTGDALSR